MKAILRDYRPEDFDRLYEIDQACYPTGIAYSRRTLRWFLALGGADCIVAEAGRDVVGFLVSESESTQGHIVTIDVLQPWRRAGIGSALLLAAEQRLASHGAREVVLETATNNEPAVSFWVKHGYRTRGLLKRYYLGRLDAFSMAKRLAGPKGISCSSTRRSSWPSSRG